jgi:hypothetical protein
MRRIIIESRRRRLDHARNGASAPQRYYGDTRLPPRYASRFANPHTLEQNDSRERTNSRPMRMPARRVVRSWKRATR